LGDLAELTDRTLQLHCEFTGDGTEVSDPTVALHLYRIAQEAVSNAIRHGLPSEIEIVLEKEGPYITLTISNDGHSIQHAPDTHDGMGIRTMKHRADLIQGSLRVAPAEGGGTVVSCRVPRKEHRHGHEQDERT
jgi:signal transduction histidine kinase